jgi:hypothetical protein
MKGVSVLVTLREYMANPNLYRMECNNRFLYGKENHDNLVKIGFEYNEVNQKYSLVLENYYNTKFDVKIIIGDILGNKYSCDIYVDTRLLSNKFNTCEELINYISDDKMINDINTELQELLNYTYEQDRLARKKEQFKAQQQKPSMVESSLTTEDNKIQPFKAIKKRSIYDF